MKQIKNIVYLYSEIMPYAVAVMRMLVKEFGATVDCIYWDNNKRTPFIPTDETGITYYKRSLYNKKSIKLFIEQKHPSLIYVSGRMDSLYLDTAAYFRNKICIVTGSDNQWNGTLRQRIGAFFSTIFYKKYFECVWVPGPRQYEYARRMGYAKNKIALNLYTGDDVIFNRAYKENYNQKAEKYPHNFVFVGRFVPIKGIDLLISAFTQVKNEIQNDWTLTLIGAGTINQPETPNIIIKSFLSGEELAVESKNFGVFCLPSHREPWGVVIHEFTMAGLPIIATDMVGAADTLVINNYNGYIYNHSDLTALKNILIKVMTTSDSELFEMGNRSHKLSKRHSPLLAAYSLVSKLKTNT